MSSFSVSRLLVLSRSCLWVSLLSAVVHGAGCPPDVTLPFFKRSGAAASPFRLSPRRVPFQLCSFRSLLKSGETKLRGQPDTYGCGTEGGWKPRAEERFPAGRSPSASSPGDIHFGSGIECNVPAGFGVTWVEPPGHFLFSRTTIGDSEDRMVFHIPEESRPLRESRGLTHLRGPLNSRWHTKGGLQGRVQGGSSGSQCRC